MKLYQQLVLFMLAATVLPLAAVGFLLLSRAESELAGRIVSEQRIIATTTAESVSAELVKTVEVIARSAEAIPWEHATPEGSNPGCSLSPAARKMGDPCGRPCASRCSTALTAGDCS